MAWMKPIDLELERTIRAPIGDVFPPLVNIEGRDVACRAPARQRQDRAQHISNILAKLHVADRAHAIVRAREAGLGTGSLP